MTIWLIEDEQEAKSTATEAVSNVCPKWELKYIADFLIPPISARAPDIAIMDLYKGKKEFKGDEIYTQLRALPSGEKTFVIVWSAYRGRRAADEFVENCANDRFAAVNNKARGDLERMLASVVDRIQRES